MSEHQANRKTRRRFLADMLFLGGGLTAAGVLAKSQFLEAKPTPEPVAAGATPMSTPAPSCTKAPLEIPPEVEGGMKLPPPQPVKPARPSADPFAQRDNGPATAGGVRAPSRPQPTRRPMNNGGMMMPRYDQK